MCEFNLALDSVIQTFVLISHGLSAWFLGGPSAFSLCVVLPLHENPKTLHPPVCVTSVE